VRVSDVARAEDALMFVYELRPVSATYPDSSSGCRSPEERGGGVWADRDEEARTSTWSARGLGVLDEDAVIVESPTTWITILFHSTFALWRDMKRSCMIFDAREGVAAVDM